MKKKISRSVNILWKGIVLFLLSFLFLISIQYVAAPVYNFTHSRPFAGDSIYNPYDSLERNWKRANFHCHSIAWGGVTYGNQPLDEVYEHYYNHGYDILGVSNYQKISRPFHGETYIPTYEHGINVKQNHHIVIGSRDESFTDFFLWKNAHQKQYVINRLKKKGGMIVLAHPSNMGAFRKGDMWKLSGYDFIEALNHYKKSFDIWDAALSSGYLCWIMANDDSHNIEKKGETCVNWNMIDTKGKTSSSVLAALKAGRHYGVNNRQKHRNTNYLDSAWVRGQRVFVRFTKPAGQITFIGDHGHQQKIVENSAQASYTFSPEDSYIRVKAQTKEASIYLNPFIRYDGEQIPALSDKLPVSNTFLTVLYRILALLVSSILLIIVLLVSGNAWLVKTLKGWRLMPKKRLRRGRTLNS